MRRQAIICICNPENRRAKFFTEACRREGFADPTLIAWKDFLEPGGAERLRKMAEGAQWVRIESPGEDFEVEKALLHWGERAMKAEPYSHLSGSEIDRLHFERGRILCLRQWYHGWCGALHVLSATISEGRPSARFLSAPGNIEVFFDKYLCSELLEKAGVRVPKRLGVPVSGADLLERMEQTKTPRVFVKPCHSSSGSGVVALETDGRRIRASTPLEIARRDGRIVLFNTLLIKRYEDPRLIVEMLDTLCQERVTVEEWFPKAGWKGMRFDLRVLVVGGNAQHVVMRQSRHAITNLHLGNQRGCVEEIQRAAGEKNWRRAMEVCEAAAGRFPESLYVAVDLLIGTGFSRFRVAEINAFGDLLPGVRFHGRSTYEAEMNAVRMNAGLLAEAQVSTSGT